MIKHSKRYYEIKKTLKKDQYTINDALTFFKGLPPLLNRDNLELHISLNLKKKEFKKYFFTLSYPLYNPKKICVLVTETELQYYKNLDVDIIGSRELLYPIFINEITFDMLFTTFNFYPQVRRLVRKLVPLRLFPNTKVGNLTSDIKGAISNIKQGNIIVKSDSTHVLHLIVGRMSFTLNALKDNIKKIGLTIREDCPSKYTKLVKTVALCSTMGPSIFLNKKEVFDNEL